MFRLRPFDTSTESGRSRERIRRAAITTISAGGARGLGIVASLITVPLTYRYLGPERYGLWMVLVSIISAMAFADLGIGNGLLNAIAEAYGKDDRVLARRYFTSAFVLLLGVAVALALGAAIAYPYIPWMRLLNVNSAAVAAEGTRALLVLFGWFVVSIPLGSAMRAQMGLQRGYVSQTVNGFGSIVTLLALLAVIHLQGSLPWLVFGSTVGPIAAALVNAAVLFYQHPWLMPSWKAYSSGAAWRILRMGLMFFVLQCSVVAAYTSDNIVISQIMGTSAVAAYAVPQKLFAFISLVVSIGLVPLWPAYGEAIARGDVRWIRKTFMGSIWIILAFTIPSSLLLALGGPWILRTFFGKALHASALLLAVLAMWAVIEAVSTAVGVLLNGLGILRIQMLIAPLASAINLSLSIYLTRRLGVCGVCLGSLIAQSGLTLPFYWVLIRRRFRRMIGPTDQGRARQPVEVTSPL